MVLIPIATVRSVNGFFFLVFFLCVCLCWMSVDVVLLLHVIYSRTIAPVANVFCWLYPTLNQIYLILSYLVNKTKWGRKLNNLIDFKLYAAVCCVSYMAIATWGKTALRHISKYFQIFHFVDYWLSPLLRLKMGHQHAHFFTYPDKNLLSVFFYLPKEMRHLIEESQSLAYLRPAPELNCHSG